MSEFNLIEKYFTRPSPSADLGIGDDSALISIRKGYQLAVSTDMLVVGTHFFSETAAYDIGWKALAVNLSDMAAMGAQPRWATLAIALPDVNQTWLAEFSQGIFACAEIFDVELIGGDTTKGPLNLSITIMGEVPTGKALRRDSAQIGDDIWVSGTIGDAAIGLSHLQNKLHSKFYLDDGYIEYCLDVLHRPQPRVKLGLALQGLAHSAIDISDGLLSDLGHILKASNVGAEIQLSALPFSLFASKHIHEKLVQHCVLAGGDDYELCFTAPKNMRENIKQISTDLKLPISLIGNIREGATLVVMEENMQKPTIEKTGYDHFA
ncbi:MAG: thiamine-phosphate kinase [Methylophilaceae bacterium]